MNTLKSDLFPSMPAYVRRGQGYLWMPGKFCHYERGSVYLTQCRTYAMAKDYFGEGLVHFRLRLKRAYRSRYDQLARDLLATNIRYLRLMLRSVS